MSNPESFKNMVTGVECEIPNASITIVKEGSFNNAF